MDRLPALHGERPPRWGLSLSEVIEDFIRRNSGMREEEAFAAFIEQDRIRAWVGTDEGRRERLRREFARDWSALHPPMTAARPAAERARPPPEPVQVEVRRPPAPAAPVAPQFTERPAGITTPPKKLHVLCPTCGKYDVVSLGGLITCRTCQHKYDNMLDLVPVRPVGPFSFLFGEGWKGIAIAGGILVALVVVYLLLRV